MTVTIPLHLALALVGAINTGLLAAVMGFRAWERRDGAMGRLALLCASFASVIALIIFSHAGLVQEAVWTTLVELGLTVFAGLLLYDYVRAATTRALPIWAYVAVPILCAGLILLEGGTDPALDRLAVTVQMLFTLFAVIHWVRFAGPRGERDELVFAVLLSITLVHVAQAVRTNAAALGALEDVVPVLAAVLAVGMTVAVLLRAGLVRRLQDRPKDDSGLVLAFDHLMAERRLYLDPDVTLSKVAAALGHSPQKVSAALNAAGQGFYERLAAYRIGEAKRLLTDPGEARTSIEAVALLSGFKSRSSFYEAFKAETGTTPAAWRKSAG